MLRQTYEIRANRSTAEKQMEFQRIARKEEIDRTESSFAGNCRLTQKQFHESMRRADKVASKWL